jgi:hypothetical protein
MAVQVLEKAEIFSNKFLQTSRATRDLSLLLTRSNLSPNFVASEIENPFGVWRME